MKQNYIYIYFKKTKLIFEISFYHIEYDFMCNIFFSDNLFANKSLKYINNIYYID